MRRLLERRFPVQAPIAAVWDHLAKVEQWPTWARHIRRIDLQPPGPLQVGSRGTIKLTNGVRSTFTVVELDAGHNWKWVGPFLWLTVHYDHEFREIDRLHTEVGFSLDGQGPAVGVFGRLFAALYARNLDRAIPRLVGELEKVADTTHGTSSPQSRP